jgi:hypothetical protein
MDSTVLSAEAEALRAQLLEGLAPVPLFAAAANRTVRQINTWISEGLPIVRIGRTPYVVIEKARPWLVARKPVRSEQVKRGPGRPKKAVATR